MSEAQLQHTCWAVRLKEEANLREYFIEWLQVSFPRLNNHNARHCNLVCTWLNNEVINIVHESHLIRLIRRISSISTTFVAYHQRIITLVPP